MVEAGEMLAGVGTAVSGFADMVVWLIIVAVLSALAFGVLYVLQFKHKVRLRRVTSSKKFIMDFRCKEFRDKDETEWLKLLTFKKELKLLPKPTADAIDIDDKGRLVFEGYIGDYGEVIWAKDTAQVKPIPKDITSLTDAKQRKERIEQWSREQNVITAFQPLTSTQRALYVARIKRAQERKRSDWKDNIPMIASFAMITIVLIILIVSWDTIAQPALDSKQMTKTIIDTQKETMQLLQDIKSNTQSIKMDGDT